MDKSKAGAARHTGAVHDGANKIEYLRADA
jgi:hypothetical protein